MAALFVITAGLMLNQYFFLRKEASKLIALQGEYNEYLVKLNAIIEDFQKSTETSEDDSEEKKKDNFVIVNRSPEYLSSSLLSYLKENNLNRELSQLRKMNYIPKGTRPAQRRNAARRRQATQKNRTVIDIPRQIINDINLDWPLDLNSFWISSYFGPRRKADRTPGFHYGVDLAAIRGTIVKAAADGKVIESGHSKGYGNTIVIQHTPKYKTRYAHLHTLKIKVGAEVVKGQKIGTVGSTGHIRSVHGDGSHLHFEVIVGNRKINPLWVLPKIS